MAEAHRIESEQEALDVARRFAEQIRPESGNRDRERRLPIDEIEWFSHSGLLGITVPDRDGYLLSGEKFHCTGALFAHWVPVRVTDLDGNRVVAVVNRRSEGLNRIAPPRHAWL
jgi:alkylation response protein AidB-like acyl-CoA dehydrogenase